jgi:iron complex transport system permease protein
LRTTLETAPRERAAIVRPAPGGVPGALAAIAGLLVAVALVAGWHLTQGTSGVGFGDLIAYFGGAQETVGGVPIGDIFAGSRLPRLLAGIAVGLALGVGGMLLQSITRNVLASPDTLAVTSGSHLALTAVAAFGISVPIWASTGVAFIGGIGAAAIVLGLAGRSSGTATTRLILAGSALAMAFDALTGMLLILFKESTIGLFAWGSGSLAQLSIDASLRALPLIFVVLIAAMLLSRRLDVLGLGDDAAASLGVPLRSTRLIAIVLAVLLSSTAVTVAGPIAFVGLGAPVLTRLLATKVRGLGRHVLRLPASGLVGALLVLLADAVLRAILGAESATSIPTGIPTALLGAVMIVILAMRLRDSGPVRQPPQANHGLRTRHRFTLVWAIAAVALVAAAIVGLLAGSIWLKTGDISVWLQGSAPSLIDRALDERLPRVGAAVLAGAALGLAGTVVQSTVRNPLAEPGLLGITAGAGLGAVIIVTAGIPGRAPLIAMAVLMGLLTFGLIALLASRGGLLPDRFVLIGIGCGTGFSAISTFLLLRANPYDTPRIFTWLSGTTYGRTLVDLAPVAIALALAIPLLISLRRELDLLAVDEDTPRVLGVRLGRTRFVVLAIAAVLAAVAVVAIGVIGFVGLIAPHLARALVGSRHSRVIPVSMLLGGLLVCVADMLGRSLIAPSQLPAGLMIALIGAPYFVWLLRSSRS